MKIPWNSSRKPDTAHIRLGVAWLLFPAELSVKAVARILVLVYGLICFQEPVSGAKETAEPGISSNSVSGQNIFSPDGSGNKSKIGGNTMSGNKIPYWEQDVDVRESVNPSWDVLDEVPVEHVENSSLESKKHEIKVGYKFAYSSRYFYVMVIAHTNTTVCRDRGYQNGDGFHFVFALPKPNEKNEAITDEFYVLGFWNAGSNKNEILTKQMIWYQNRDLSFGKLNGSVFSIKKTKDAVIYQTAVPWSDIPPFKPYFMNEIGINFCFVQAVGHDERNLYFRLFDDQIRCEQSDRKYALYQFEKMTNNQRTDILERLSNNFIRDGKTAEFQVAINTPRLFEIDLEIKTPKRAKSIKHTVDHGITIKKYPVDLNELAKGMNQVSITIEKPAGGLSSYDLLKLDESDITNFDKTLSSYEGSKTVPEEDIISLQFLVNDLKAESTSFKDYSSPRSFYERYESIKNLFDELKSAGCVLRAGSGTVVRRAFKSKLDDSLQPYSIRFPKKFESGKKYPLVVFLHGSGEDDRWLKHAAPSIYDMADSFNAFILTPKGRGVSDCYTHNHANDDVIEALMDVYKVFPVNEEKIILAGFSMGGYGVYRVGYEFQKYFAGFLVLSGDPSVGRKWCGTDHPDFMQESYLNKLPKKPFFIVHGKEDRNCPYKDTAAFVEKFKFINPDVVFLIDDSSGHSGADNDQTQKIIDWLKQKSLL